MSRKKTQSRSAEEENRLKWDNSRVGLAKMFATLRSRGATTQAESVTLQSALVEAINDLDSSVSDPVGSMGSNEEQPNVNYETGSGKGRIQKIQDLRLSLFGEDGDSGLFATIRDLIPPEV